MYRNYVINLKREIRTFTGLMVELDMPPFDRDAALSRIFDCFREKATAMQKLMEVCEDMADHDGLFESEYLYDYQRERVFYAVQELGKKIWQRLDEINPYVNGKFPYSYKRIFYGCALLMADAPAVSFDPGKYRTRYTR